MYGLHYHNSLHNSETSQGYSPRSTIHTEPLSEKFTIGEQIGRGKFAVVKKCTNNETKEEVAAKFIKKRRRGKSCREEILREVVMLELALAHPRLVDLKEVYETQSELILITEYCAGGELFTECVLEESFQEEDVRLLMTQILEGIVYLHQKNIVHLDLKPQNILLTERFPAGMVKICDLGFACLVNTGEDIRDIIGTPDYVAPEVLNYDPLGLYTDMWSLGVLTYVMLTTYSPFAGEDKTETFCNITSVNLDFPDDLFANISSAAQDFIKKLLIAEPSERMTARDCELHPWMSGITSPSRMLTSPVPVSDGPSTSSTDDTEPEPSTDDDLQSGQEPEAAEGEPIPVQETESVDTLHDSLSGDLVPPKNTISTGTLEDVPSLEGVPEPKPSSVNEELDTSMSSVHVQPTSVIGDQVEPGDGVVLETGLVGEPVFPPTEGDKVNDIELTSDKGSIIDAEDTEMYKSVLENDGTDPDFSGQRQRSGSDMSTEEQQMESVNYKESDIRRISQDSDLCNRSAHGEPVIDLNIQDLNQCNIEKNEVMNQPPRIVLPHAEQNDTEMTSKSSIEVGQGQRFGDFNQNNVTIGNTGEKSVENSHTEHIHVRQSSSDTDIPSKRVKCNDSSSTQAADGAEEDEEQYEFVSVSNRVRSIEDTIKTSPLKSPRASPRSPRVGRHSNSPRLHHRSPNVP